MCGLLDAGIQPHVAPEAHRRPRTVGMVSFDVPFARIDAKGLGNGGRDLGIKKIGAAGRPTARLYAHALPRCRVVALFSPATRDEAAATCAGFAGPTGLVEFDRSRG